MKRVWYHGNCYDGFTSCWIASLALGRDKSQIEFVPCSYGMPVPDFDQGDTIYILDFSFPREKLIEINKRAGELVVLDHHKSARDDLEGLEFCHFDMERSGAGMTWDYFFNTPRMNFINWIEDYDLWRFTFSETKPFNALLSSQPFTFAAWDNIRKQTRNFNSSAKIIEKGELILASQNTLIEKMCSHSWITTILGYPVAVINATFLWSGVGQHLLDKHPEAKFSASFGFMNDGRILWSLRSRKGEIDVSTVAKAFGGGGHFSAAGMKTKTINEVFTKWGE